MIRVKVYKKVMFEMDNTSDLVGYLTISDPDEIQHIIGSLEYAGFYCELDELPPGESAREDGDKRIGF